MGRSGKGSTIAYLLSVWHTDLANLQNGPQPTNDQFSLALILLQLLHGDDDRLQLLWARYHPQTGQLDLSGLAFPVPSALERKLQIDASQRYPDLHQAIQALQALQALSLAKV